MVNCTIRGQQRSADQLKLTWEVCQEDGISSYRMHQNPKYAVIDELRAEKLLLHSPSKDNNDEDTIVEEGGASKYVYEDTQEEGQYNYVEQNQGQEYNNQQEQYQEGEYTTNTTPVEQDYSHLHLSESDNEDDV
jgi:hypothetical protein